MSTFFLVVVSFAGLAGYLVREAARVLPRSNDDFVFC